jgi:hypothetical protein
MGREMYGFAFPPLVRKLFAFRRHSGGVLDLLISRVAGLGGVFSVFVGSFHSFGLNFVSVIDCSFTVINCTL